MYDDDIDLPSHAEKTGIELIQVVRCKDCKHRPEYPEAYGAEIDGKWCYWCEHLKSWEPDDWFCADGVRKE